MKKYIALNNRDSIKKMAKQLILTLDKNKYNILIFLVSIYLVKKNYKWGVIGILSMLYFNSNSDQTKLKPITVTKKPPNDIKTQEANKVEEDKEDDGYGFYCDPGKK